LDQEKSGNPGRLQLHSDEKSFLTTLKLQIVSRNVSATNCKHGHAPFVRLV
jgi:hypothetical protein